MSNSLLFQICRQRPQGLLQIGQLLTVFVVGFKELAQRFPGSPSHFYQWENSAIDPNALRLVFES
ncbi:hypothetical protein C2134_01560 [Chromobacterium sinusclupearum]|uniref:Uncharacterized protein n=1 Tax=Chromobacterium sinusclupearum TaxID=2077146 RepID=A0A2K4MTQ0_9NEIS|nr:hypothetical protein C2134_01560 [Chromobacterium sinusclupearum]